MKLNSFTLVAILLFFVTANVFSQESPKIKKEEFNVSDMGFKEAWKGVKKGNKFYKIKQKGAYQVAIEHYLVAYEYNPDCSELNYRLGICYLMIYDEDKAKELIVEAYEYNSFVAKDIHYWLGRVYHLNNEFDKAIEEYKTYRDNLTEKEVKKDPHNVNKCIEECKIGIKYVENPKNVLIDNLGEGVNSEYPDYAPVWAPYDSVIFFTSRRSTNAKGKKAKRNKKVSYEFYEDIFFTSYKNGVWKDAGQFGKPINTKGNDASVAVNPNGNLLLVYRGKKRNGGIYITNYDSNKERWTKPKQVIRKINKKNYKESTLTFSKDSTTVYFVSDRKGGVGGKDIWYSKRKGNSNSGWSRPKNMGTDVNSIYNEEAVFLTKNDSVLYYSSQGHGTMGGYDVFRSYRLPDGRWSEPENLGYPLNTAGDDLFFVTNRSMRSGYFTSNGQEDCYGDNDLYEFFFYDKKEPDADEPDDDDLIAYIKRPVNELIMEEPVPITTMQLTVLKLTVVEYESLIPLAATIEIIDNETQELIQTIQTNVNTGKCTVMLPSGKDYGMTVNSPGYMFHSDNVIVPEATGYNEVEKEVQLLPVNPGAKIVLSNVFFDSGKHKLKEESFPELTKLARVFSLYPKLVIEISGHTDSQGAAGANKALSERRAKACVDYMVSIGVQENQLTSAGYGEDEPRDTNKTKEGRANNRRVEAKIISN